MAEALVSPVVEQLVSIMARELEQEVRLVVGVEEEVKMLKSNLSAIQAVLADAETRQVKEATVRDWLEKLRDVVYDIEMCWTIGKPQFSAHRANLETNRIGRSLRERKIRELNEKLDHVSQEKERYKFVSTELSQPIERSMTVSMIDITEVKGRDHDKSVLVSMLLSEPTVVDRRDLPVISIVGMGGIGKTTLAQLVFNDNSVEAYFDKKIWVCVSNPFHEIRIAEAILESLLGRATDVRQLQSLLEKIMELIKEKKILLVLDDVWEHNSGKWDKLKQSLRHALPGSKVLVTTRKNNVASIMGCSNADILPVKELHDEECWSILSKIAFFNRNDMECKHLEELGKKISSKCRGLPLAAKALGSTLRFRKTKEEWQQILDSEIWEVEEAQRDVFGPLWLSYYDLSPELKRCFSYCAIFPKAYEIKKRELILLWKAQGYLMGRQSDDLDIVGEYYFQNLAMRSFFQDFKKDSLQRIYRCKMHDIVHDLAQIVARSECHCAQVDDPVELIRKVRHLSLSLPEHGSYFNLSHGFDKKRSLFSWSKPTTEELSSLLGELTHIRSLSLRYGDFAEIPPSIRKLVQLRWLDLSRNRKLKQLPETICELHSLQTIDVTWCSQLKLPLGIGKLINLRHLRNLGGPSRLPKGIAHLTGLRTLGAVDVGCGGDAFSLGDLRNFNQLRRSLMIENLGEYNRHVGEAKQAELKKKEHVTHLTLVFFYIKYKEEEEGEERCTPRKEELLLEALEPSPNLEILNIDYYGGTTFPGWMISLTNLRSIRLRLCRSCEHLPSLGKLPSLETLELWGMSGVKEVGLELLAIETQIGDGKSQISAAAASSSSSSSPVVVAFPKLTTLEFRSMNSWEEWDDYYDGTTKPPSIIIMPSLRSLKIHYCLRLRALPDYILQSALLHTLEIRGCDLLEERYKEKGEDWSKISHISHVSIS